MASCCTWPVSSVTSLLATDALNPGGIARDYRRRMTSNGAGPLLREWRGRRRRSQLDLASAAGVSPKHLSFVETGRSKPSPELLLTLAIHLDVPLRDRNSLLLAPG